MAAQLASSCSGQHCRKRTDCGYQHHGHEKGRHYGLHAKKGGGFFGARVSNKITIGLEDPQNLPSLSHFFVSILQLQQTASIQIEFLCCRAIRWYKSALVRTDRAGPPANHQVGVNPNLTP